MIRPDRPYDMNGSANPVVGMSPRFTRMEERRERDRRREPGGQILPEGIGRGPGDAETRASRR